MHTATKALLTGLYAGLAQDEASRIRLVKPVQNRKLNVEECLNDLANKRLIYDYEPDAKLKDEPLIRFSFKPWGKRKRHCIVYLHGREIVAYSDHGPGKTMAKKYHYDLTVRGFGKFLKDEIRRGRN